MIRLARIDHVCLSVDNVDEARVRWANEFGLLDRGGGDGIALLACEDEPYSLELVEGEPGHHHTAFELAPDCPLDEAERSLDEARVEWEQLDGAVYLTDPDGFRIELMPHREREPWVAHARRSKSVHPGAPGSSATSTAFLRTSPPERASMSRCSGCASPIGSAPKGSGSTSTPTIT